jgi:hypothetical protein
MAKQQRDHHDIEGKLSDKEMIAELRYLGYRLTGNESHQDLRQLLNEELNRQWIANATKGKVIRRRRSNLPAH